MNAKCLWFGLLLLSCPIIGFGQSPPPIPNQEFPFIAPNYGTVFGNAPLGFTNISSASVTAASSVLILDTTNSQSFPAYLNYNVQDTNPTSARNINYSQATVFFDYVPNWSSVSLGGTGPGTQAMLIAGGDWSSGSPNGLYQIFIDPTGANLCFAGIQSGTSNLIISTPISFSSNVFYQIAIEWSLGSDAEIYTNQALAATSGTGPGFVPAHSTWTNGFWIGSDNVGSRQMRGGIFDLITWNQELVGIETNWWAYDSNILATWQAGLGGGFGGMMGMGLLTSGCPCTNCTTGTNVYIANMASMADTNGDGGVTYIFAIEGGMPQVPYDVFTTSGVSGSGITASTWTWLGQGTNCGYYQITNQPTGQSFYVLGTPFPAADGSGLTQAYEALVHSSSSGGDGISGLYKLLHGLSLSTSIAVPSLSSISIPTCPVQ